MANLKKVFIILIITQMVSLASLTEEDIVVLRVSQSHELYNDLSWDEELARTLSYVMQEIGHISTFNIFDFYIPIVSNSTYSRELFKTFRDFTNLTVTSYWNSDGKETYGIVKLLLGIEFPGMFNGEIRRSRIVLNSESFNDPNWQIFDGSMRDGVFSFLPYVALHSLGIDFEEERNISLNFDELFHFQVFSLNDVEVNPTLFTDKIVIISCTDDSQWGFEQGLYPVLDIEGEEFLRAEIIGSAMIKIYERFEEYN